MKTLFRICLIAVAGCYVWSEIKLLGWLANLIQIENPVGKAFAKTGIVFFGYIGSTALVLLIAGGIILFLDWAFLSRGEE